MGKTRTQNDLQRNIIALKYTHVHSMERQMIRTTKVFRNGNSQAIRIPAEIAYERPDIEFEIERIGDEIRIRPAQRPLTGVLEKFAKFGKDFMAEGRGDEEQADREAL
jgi:antitoxin VapB